MQKTKIILVVHNPTTKNTYLNLLSPYEIEITVVDDLEHIDDLLIKTPYNGIIVDIVTKFKSSHKARGILAHVIDLYPISYLRYDEQSQSVQTLFYGKSSECISLDEFILVYCKKFKQRTLRADKRIKKNLNIELSRTSLFNNHVEKTVTIDVSATGCFICTIRRWELYEPGWIIIKELTDNTPIKISVQRHIEWGKKMVFPGIGVLFEKIENDQSKNLCDIIY